MNNLKKVKEYSLKNKIPIIRNKTLSLLIKILKKENVKTILEIGSGYGYSGLYLASSGFNVVSLEKNENSYLECLNAKKSFLKLEITFLNKDATTYKIDTIFDSLFIDGAKSKYEIFFNNFKENIKPGGIIFFDNFNYALKKTDSFPKRLRPISKKMKSFFQKLQENNNYEMKIYNIDDGVLVLKKK